jgi:hypothetical protein
MSGLGGNPVVPAALAALDLAVVVEALARHACNVTDAAADLAVPPSDLRRLLWSNPKLQDQAFEVVEARIDKAEKNINEALHSDDPRMRVAASMFTIRNTARAKRRGWITSAVAAADVNLTIAAEQPREIIFSWRNPGEEKAHEPGDGWETIERDGQAIRVPRYDGARHDESDCLEGALAAPTTMIEHAAVVEPELAPVVPEPAPALPDPAVRRERERIDAWVRNRLIAYPLASCLLCRKPIVAGAAWEEVSNGDTNARARFHRDCHVVWRAEREAAARQALGLGR